MSDELKQKILDFMNKKAAVKKKLTYKEVIAGLPDENRRDVKKALQALLDEGSVKAWSSGSSSYIMLPEFFPKE
ncbi:MAG: dissimilatory sulfite reductase D family protein [bacterium]